MCLSLFLHLWSKKSYRPVLSKKKNKNRNRRSKRFHKQFQKLLLKANMQYLSFLQSGRSWTTSTFPLPQFQVCSEYSLFSHFAANLKLPWILINRYCITPVDTVVIGEQFPGHYRYEDNTERLEVDNYLPSINTPRWDDYFKMSGKLNISSFYSENSQNYLLHRGSFRFYNQGYPEKIKESGDHGSYWCLWGFRSEKELKDPSVITF